MNTRRPLYSEIRLTVISLIIAAIGILILFLTGNIKQAIPVGTILLFVAAGLVAFGQMRWTFIVAFVLSLFIFIMSFIAPGLFDRLTHPTTVGAFVGTWVQELGLLASIFTAGKASIQK